MIYFRDIKTQELLNASFFIKDGDKLMDLREFHLGDKFTLLWKVSEQVAIAMENLPNRKFRASNLSFTSDRRDNLHVSIPFVVVDRRHSASLLESGTFRALGFQITLQAESWEWEDLWKWIVFGDRPGWAGEENEP